MTDDVIDTTEDTAADDVDLITRVKSLETKVDNLHAKLDGLISFAESVKTALARLEGHPMLGKLFNGHTSGESNGHGG